MYSGEQAATVIASGSRPATWLMASALRVEK
jgi:hypothetical protein